MGIPGPGGPCSEIFYDRGPQYGPEGGPTVDEDRFLEIWNLVFTEFELGAVRSKADFDIVGPLPKKNVDTGMGLERIAASSRVSTTSTRSTRSGRCSTGRPR
jgi:alanyl-tRNA synthetase